MTFVCAEGCVYVCSFVRTPGHVYDPLLCPLPGFQQEQRVYVALAGEDLQIDFFVSQPANQSGGSLKCFDHKNEVIHNSEVVILTIEKIKGSVKLRNLVSNHSGEYHCEYNSAKAYWALLVKGESARKGEKIHQRKIFFPPATL